MRIFFISVISAFLITTSISAQDYSGAVSFVQQFKNVNEEVPRESVYLHTDRDWYFHGERIWFSAYSKIGGYNVGNLSNVLYVELVQPDGTVFERSLIKLLNGRGIGSLSLRNAKPVVGNFEIRAYTKWGLNFGSSYEFTKRFKLKVKDDETRVSSSEEFDVQFFPESGYLIEGIPTRLAFKAIDGNGLGIPVAGSIYDHKNEKVTDFESSHLGMGAVNFSPERGHTYYAMVDGNRFDLPKPKPEGVVLNANNTNGYIGLNIQASEAVKNIPYLLFAHVRGTIFHAVPVDLSGGSNSVMMPSSKFASGIVNFSLLDGNSGTVVSERQVFNNNTIDEVTVDISATGQVYDSRDPVSLKINVLNSNDEKVKATASISVFDDLIEPYDPKQKNIKTHFLLETELKGYVEDPGFYFSDHDSSQVFLDYLLMTQGWKAYNMDSLIPSEENLMVDIPEEAITITGTVSTLWRDRPIEDAAVIATIRNNDELSQITTTDSTGKFSITDLEFYGRESIIVKGNRDGSDRVWIEIDDQFSDLSTNKDPIPQYHLFPEGFGNQALSPAKDYVALQERSDEAVEQSEDLINVQMKGDLGEISVEGKREENETFVDRLLGDLSGRGSQINLQEKDYLKNLSMDMILNQIPGVTANLGTRSISVRTGFSSINAGNPGAVIYVDGMVTDPSFVFSLNSSEVKTITVARSAVDLALFGASGAGGVISIKTLSGVEAARKERGLKRMGVLGFQEPTEFYTPKYGVTVPNDYEQKDSRITLYWDPKLEINEDNNDVRFWMNDIPSTYRIVVEGLTEAGDPFVHTSVLEQN